MKALMTGLYSHFTAEPHNSLYNAVGGRLYHQEAPQCSTFPYVIMQAVYEEHDWTFTEEIESILVQFTIYSQARSAANIGNLCSYLKSLYDDADLIVVGFTPVHMIRSNAQLLRDPKNNMWQYIIEYECFLRAS